MKSQIVKSIMVCKHGLATSLVLALLVATPSWGQTDFLADFPANFPAPTHGLVNWPGAVVYPKMDEAKPLISLPAGAKVELLERSNPWWKVRHGDKVGWIHRLFLEVQNLDVPATEPILFSSSQAGSQAGSQAMPAIPASQGDLAIISLPDEPSQTTSPQSDGVSLPVPVPVPVPVPEPIPDPIAENVGRSAFQMSMLALDAQWKARLQGLTQDSSLGDERFTTQLLKNSKMAWAPQVIAPSRLVIGKDNFKLWLKSSKAGYVYVWSEAEDGELTLVFPNQRDVDNRVLAGEVLYLPRKNWPIKSSGPAGLARLMVMVSEVPRPLPPPTALIESMSVSSAGSLAPPSMPSLLGHEVLKRHPFWMSSKTTLGSNPALLQFLNPELKKEDCNPKKPQCSNTYGVKSLKLMKVEPEP